MVLGERRGSYTLFQGGGGGLLGVLRGEGGGGLMLCPRGEVLSLMSGPRGKGGVL